MSAEKLPDSWETTTLGEISDLAGGGTPSRVHPEYFIGDIVWLTPTEIPRNRVTVISNSKEKITQEGLKNSSARLLPKGTVLMTSRASIGYVAIAGSEVTTNQGFASFICKEAIYNHYLAYWLLGNADYFIEQATGTTFKEIIKSKLRNFTIPLPPFPEQERIVDCIESLFTQLDAGAVGLKRAQAALKRYKASVLKAACEGRLVAQDPSDEPAEELLRRLGRAPLTEYKLPELPEGWCWTTWNQVGVSQNGRGFPSKEYQSRGVKLLRPGNLFANGNFIWTEENTRYMPEKWASEFPAFIVGPGELIMNLTAQSLKDEFLGRICITGVEEHCLLNQRLARLKPVVGETRYFLWLFKSNLFRQFVDGLNTGSLIQHMFTSQLAEFILPLPPLSEQRRIVAEVERRLSVVQELEQIIEANLKRASHLRQAILKRAFEGRLVAQNELAVLLPEQNISTQ